MRLKTADLFDQYDYVKIDFTEKLGGIIVVIRDLSDADQAIMDHPDAVIYTLKELEALQSVSSVEQARIVHQFKMQMGGILERK